MTQTIITERNKTIMKKIGFIDYYMSEWHANNYPNWMADACAKLGYDYKVAYAWAEMDKGPLDGVTTAEWCEKFGAEKCETIEELCEKSDVIVILAPSNPETHLRLAEPALKYGKRTYIDKTFAPDYATAVKIFEAGKAGNSPFFSTSALRYCEEMNYYETLKDVKSVIITGPGGSFEEYIIHQVEMLVKICNKKPVKCKVETVGLTSECTVMYEDGTRAKLIYSPRYPFTAYADDGVESGEQKPIVSGYFPALMEEILKFFETGVLPFDSQQTLDCMKIREALITGLSKDGQWIEL